MGPDRDAGVVPTQLNRAVGGNEADVRPVSGVPAGISTDGDPPTLPLPTVPGGYGPRPSSDDSEPGRREHRSSHRRAGQHRGLKRAIWATTVALILAIGALVATDVHPWHLFNTTPANTASAHQHRPASKATSAALEPVSVGSYIATYDVTSSTFSVTLSTDRPTWVEAGASASSQPTFAGELPAGGTKQLQANGPLWVEVGAGGSTLVVQAGGKVIGTLHPALAPWQGTFTPTSTPTSTTATSARSGA